MIEREGTGEVDWKRIIKEAEGKNCKFELNAERDRKPVKFLKKWSDMVALAFFIFSHFITEYVVPGAIPVCASVCLSVCVCVCHSLLFEHYWTDFDETWTT